MAPTLDLALVQFRPRKGDYASNIARIGAFLARVASIEPRSGTEARPTHKTSYR